MITITIDARPALAALARLADRLVDRAIARWEDDGGAVPARRGLDGTPR